MLELVNSTDRHQFIQDDDAWITLEKLKKGIIPVAKFVHDLDEIPRIDTESISFEDYSNSTRMHAKDSVEDIRIFSLTSSRGCQYMCNFCASHTVHGRKVRLISADRILSDIHFFIDKYNVNSLVFEDDHFLFDKNRSITILNGLENKGLHVDFPNGISIFAIDEDIVTALKRAGVDIVTLAVESGSEYVLKNIIHKPIDLKRVKQAISILRKHGIYVRAFFILGFPGETHEHRMETYNFIKTAGFNWVAIMIASPIAGSELYKECVEKGYLLSDDITNYHFDAGNISTEDFTGKEIEDIRYRMNLDVNFINNYEMAEGYYETALIGFKDVLSKHAEHAFAHYCSALCYQALGDEKNKAISLDKTKRILKESEVWSGYFNEFKLSIDI